MSVRKCSVDGCDKTHKSKGLCAMHLWRMKCHGEVGPAGYLKDRKNTKPCAINGCESLNSGSFGYCNMHYRRISAHGDPSVSSRNRWQPCRVDECDVRDHKGHGYCRRHYFQIVQKAYKYGVEVGWMHVMQMQTTCDVCDNEISDKNRHIDHDHACCPGKVSVARPACGQCIRGVLCNGCNTALGLLRDDPDRIHRLLGYITRQSSVDQTNNLLTAARSAGQEPHDGHHVGERHHAASPQPF